MSQDDFSSIQHIFNSSQSFLIILHPQPTFDQVATALALHLSLQHQKKEVSIACAEPMKVEMGNLVGVDQITTEVGNRSLRVTFDYVEEMVEHVGYDIDKENNKFYLLIRPQKGHRPLDPTTVQYSHVGIDAETIIMVGVHSFDDIQEFYASEEQSFRDAHTVAINKGSTSFANSSLTASGYTSLSEMVGQMMKQFEWEMNSDIATNLLAGIEQATDSFRQFSVSADTLELSAKLMRDGARRLRLQSGDSAHTAQTSSLAQAFANQKKKAEEKSNTPDVPQLKRVDQPEPGKLNYTPPVR